MTHAGSFAGLAYRFRLIVDGLRRTVPTHQLKDPSSCPLVGVIWSDLGRRLARFERLLVRIEAGIPDRVRPSRAGRPAAPRAADADVNADAATAAAVARKPRLPTRVGWLMLMMPWVVAPYGTQLRHWLTDPDAEALVRSSRQMRRLLRPLLRSLSTDPLPECLLEPDAGEAPGAGTEPASGSEGAAVVEPESATGPQPGCAAAVEDPEIQDDAVAPVRTGRMARRVAAARRGAAAMAAAPCEAQAAQVVSPPASACGFETAPVESPPLDWWRVQDERRRAALAIARGSVSRA